MEYQLYRSRRKSLAIQVRADGGVEVRAPLSMPLRQIEDFLQEKQEWIRQTQQRQNALSQKRRRYRLAVGETLPLLGREYPIRASDRTGFQDAFLVRPGSPIAGQLEQIYRALAKEFLNVLAAGWAKRAGVVPAGIGITGAASRYGSCSGKNRLNFTWKLMLAPPELVEYVVVHELCHIRQHNHSPRFWAEVEALLPDYRERRQRLGEFGAALFPQEWGEEEAAAR